MKLAGALVVLALAGCSVDRGGLRSESCADRFAVGELVVLKEMDAECRDADGEMTFLGVGSLYCDDGSILGYNDLAVWNADGRVVAEFDGEFDGVEQWCAAG